MSTVFWCIVVATLAYGAGWRNAHITVATECERLGKFYVGETVYECTVIKKESFNG